MPSSHFLKIQFNIVPHLLLDLTSGLFPSSVPTKTLYAPLLSPTRATCPAQLIILGLITHIKSGEKYTSWNFSLCSFHHSRVTSPLLSPNILLSTLLSNTLSLRSYLDARNKFSHLNKTRGKMRFKPRTSKYKVPVLITKQKSAQKTAVETCFECRFFWNRSDMELQINVTQNILFYYV